MKLFGFLAGTLIILNSTQVMASVTSPLGRSTEMVRAILSHDVVHASANDMVTELRLLDAGQSALVTIEGASSCRVELLSVKEIQVPQGHAFKVTPKETLNCESSHSLSANINMGTSSSGGVLSRLGESVLRMLAAVDSEIVQTHSNMEIVSVVMSNDGETYQVRLQSAAKCLVEILNVNPVASPLRPVFAVTPAETIGCE